MSSRKRKGNTPQETSKKDHRSNGTTAAVIIEDTAPPKGIGNRFNNKYRETYKFKSALQKLKLLKKPYEVTSETTNDEVFDVLAHEGYVWRDHMWQLPTYLRRHTQADDGRIPFRTYTFSGTDALDDQERLIRTINGLQQLPDMEVVITIASYEILPKAGQSSEVKAGNVLPATTP